MAWLSVTVNSQDDSAEHIEDHELNEVTFHVRAALLLRYRTSAKRSSSLQRLQLCRTIRRSGRTSRVPSSADAHASHGLQSQHARFPSLSRPMYFSPHL